jgi:hypothetical protein
MDQLGVDAAVRQECDRVIVRVDGLRRCLR